MIHCDNFCGQLCYICGDPIHGYGIVANLLDTDGARFGTSFHAECYCDGYMKMREALRQIEIYAGVSIPIIEEHAEDLGVIRKMAKAAVRA